MEAGKEASNKRVLGVGNMRVDELSEAELRRHYVLAVKQYNNAYKVKKEIEEEMFRRFEAELEKGRK